MSGAICIRAALALELAVIVGGTHGCDLLAESNFDSLLDFDFVGVTINFEDPAFKVEKESRAKTIISNLLIFSFFTLFYINL